MPAGRRPFKSRPPPAIARKDNIVLSAEIPHIQQWYNSARFTMDGLHRFDVSPAMMQAADEIEAAYQLSSYTADNSRCLEPAT